MNNKTERTLGRIGARELSREELDHILGASSRLNTVPTGPIGPKGQPDGDPSW